MRKEMVAQFICPNCGSGLEAHSVKSVEIRYSCEKTNCSEIREGLLICRHCDSKFEIKHFIPSFLQPDQVNNKLVNEGAFWGEYYSFLDKKGITNFVDIQSPFSPLYRLGILEKVGYNERTHLRKFILSDVRIFQNDESSRLIDNDFIDEQLKQNSNVLEIGCGSGWLSLELKRKGFNVVGLDPSLSSLRIAKDYSISRGMQIEYVHADASLPVFKNSVFDGVFAFHALHHVNDVEKVVENIRQWLGQRGTIAFYEHRQALSSLDLVRKVVYLIFFPILSIRYKRDKHIFSFFLSLQSHKSPAEDAAVQLIDHFSQSFDIVRKDLFFHFLDEIPCLTYFTLGRNPNVLEKTARIVDLIQRRLKTSYPDKAEFVLCVGFNHRR